MRDFLEKTIMSEAMRNIRLFSLLLFGLALSVGAWAQDDLYYDPTTDRRTYESRSREQNNVTRRVYDDEYDYYDDGYDFEYSSRIRRFHRPLRIVDYYDPFFVDMWMYDPFFTPGVTIYVGGFADYWMWRRWMRWRAWNAWAWNDPFWGWGFNTWGWGWGAWNHPWYNPWVWNSYFYDPYWVWNGYNPYFCPTNVWINNNYFFNNPSANRPGGYAPRTYTGPRRGGTEVSPGYARIVSNTAPADRLAAPRAGAEVIELKPQRPSGRADVAPAEPMPRYPARTDEGGVRPTTPPRSDSEGVRPDGRRPEATPAEPYRPGRGMQPERTPREAAPERPARPMTPERAPRTEPDVRSERPGREATEPQRLPRRDERPAREYTPQRREAPRSNDGSYDRPARSPESRPTTPSYERPAGSPSGRSGGGNFERSGGNPGRTAPSGGSSPRGRQ